jgi:hypothetical protein
VIGAERNGCVIAGCGSAPLFVDQLLHQSHDIDIALQVRRFVEGIASRFAFGGTQMDEADA